MPNVILKKETLENRSQNSTGKENNNKKVYIEILRCIAIFFVIFNHTGDFGYRLYTQIGNDVLKICYMIFSVICKSAVPIFFIISGGLLLSKDESVKVVLRKRILRMVIVIIVASLGQYIYKIRGDFSSFDLGKFIKNIYTDRIIVPYWFLYSYTAFLIMLPILRRLVKSMEKQHYYYIFGVYIIYKLIMPIITQIFRLSPNNYLSIFFVETNILCPIIGHFCEKTININMISKKIKIIATILLILILSIAILLTNLEIIKTGNVKTEKYLIYGDVFIAAYIYMTIKMFFENRRLPKLANSTIMIVGSCSFGTYLLETRIREIMFNHVIEYTTKYTARLIACIIAIFITICIGTGITYMLKKIPGVKKLL